MKQRRHLDDWDPIHPFHIHTNDGQKIVFTKEAYDKLPDNVKQQIDAHYKEMNTINNKYKVNPEYEAFLKRTEYLRKNVQESLKKNDRGKSYLDTEWFDENYKKGNYSFDENGLLIYNGQTYAPFGDRTQQGIVVPLRDTGPNSRSYGYNTVYYPYNVPKQYIETKPEVVNYSITPEIVEQTTNTAREKYIKEHTKYYTPWLSNLFYEPVSDKVITLTEYEKKYPYNGVRKTDKYSNAELFGNIKNEPYLTEQEFFRGVKKIIKAEKDSNPTYNITPQEYVNMYPDEYRNRKKPSEQEILENTNVSLEDILNTYNTTNVRRSLKDGGIYIKPENRGKFTALKKRTGHSSTWFKQNGTPAQKKMATFALNAAKWKH